MRLPRVLPLVIILLSLILLTLLNAASSNASTFAPLSPSPTLSTLAASGNPDTSTSFGIPVPSSQFASAIAYVDADFDIATDAQIDDGAHMGKVFTFPVLGLLNGPCNTVNLIPVFDMLEATTDFISSGVIDPAKLVAAAGPATDLLRNLAEDEEEEAIYLDSDNTGTVTGDDTLIMGPAAPNGTTLINFQGGSTPERHVDPGANGLYDVGEAIVRDDNDSGTFVAADDTLLFGATPADDTTVIDFTTSERHVEQDVNTLYNLGDGIPNHVEKYPEYLLALLDPDGPGGALPLVPRARYSGFTKVVGVTVVLQFLVFNPGDLRALPNGGAALESLGYPTVTVLQAPSLAPSNSSISDFCNITISTTDLKGQAHDNTCTPLTVPLASGCTLATAASNLYLGFDGGCPGIGPDVPMAGDDFDESGSDGATAASCDDRLTNPTSAQTVDFILQTSSLRDFDGDGLDSGLDGCPRSWSDPDGKPDTSTSDHYDPRAFTDPNSNDNDFDGLDVSCDPTPSDNTNDGDHDKDGWANRLDNCATGPPNGGATLLQPTLSLRERHVDQDVSGDYNAGEPIYLDNNNDGMSDAGDTLLSGTTDLGKTLKIFNSDERHADPETGGSPSRAGRWKVSSGDTAEEIYQDVDNDRDVSPGDIRLTDVLGFGTPPTTVMGGDSDETATGPGQATNVDLLIGFLPEVRHITINNTSGVLLGNQAVDDTGDDITVGPPSSGVTQLEFDRDDMFRAREGASGILSWEHDGGQGDLPAAGVSVLVTKPVTIKFIANSNRGQADFDVRYPFQVADGGTRGDGIGASSSGDVGCEVASNAACPLANGCLIYGTDGPDIPDGHYHRTATISRVCIGGTDSDSDGVCDADEPAAPACTGNTDGINDDDCDNDGVLDTNDNCIEDVNPAPAGFSQPDKDQDGIGDACDTFQDSDGDGFSDRLETDSEDGTECDNTVDDDGDGFRNDGCPRAGDAETACSDMVDDDIDTYLNDGCPAENASGAAGTLMHVHCAGPQVPAAGNIRTSPDPSNSHPADINGDNIIDITDISLLAAQFNQTTTTAGSERRDIAPDAPSALGGGIGDQVIDITDIAKAAAFFNQLAC